MSQEKFLSWELNSRVGSITWLHSNYDCKHSFRFSTTIQLHKRVSIIIVRINKKRKRVITSTSTTNYSWSTPVRWKLGWTGRKLVGAMLGFYRKFRIVYMSNNFYNYHQGCSGAGTRGNGIPTPFSRFALKWVWSCFKMAIFWVRSHTFLLALHPWPPLNNKRIEMKISPEKVTF